MNKMKKVLMTMFGLVMLPLLFACSNNQSAGIEAIKSKGKLVVALNPDFAPFEYQKVVDGKNQIVGSDIELAKAIATELGVELELSPMSFDNVLASVQSGKADLAISGVSKTDERSKVFDFSTWRRKRSERRKVRFKRRWRKICYKILPSYLCLKMGI